MENVCSQYYDGIWTDYGASWLNRRRFLVDDANALFLAAFLAVLITLSSTRLWVLISELIAYILEKANGSIHTHRRIASIPGRRQRLRSIGAGLPLTNLPAILDELSVTRRRSRSELGFGLRLLKSAIVALRHPSGRGLEVGIKLGSSLIGILLFTGMTIGGILSTNVVLDSTALCDSPKCGWYYTPRGSPINRVEVPPEVVRYFHEKENAAAMHESRCYGDTAPAECDGLVTNNVPYNTFDNTRCLFLGDVCYGGPDSAFTLDTGLLKAELLGINSQTQYLFRRVTSCAPLVVNSSFVETSDQPEGKGRVLYKYGRNGESDHSYVSANPLLISDVGLSGYILRTVSEHDSYHPLPELSSEQGKVTLIFIQSVKLVYPTKSEDPIFPADFPFQIGRLNKTFWMNSLEHATVLGCVDEYEIYDAKTMARWTGSLLSQGAANPATTPGFSDDAGNAFLAVQMALLQSNIYNSIRMRTASALDAQYRFEDPISSALDPSQWKLELSKMFRTSLARAQIELIDIANGAWADTPGFENHMKPLQRQYICRMIKVRASGKLGISVSSLKLVVAMCFLVVMSSITHDEEFIVVQFIKLCCVAGWQVAKLGIAAATVCLGAIWIQGVIIWDLCRHWFALLGRIRL